MQTNTQTLVTLYNQLGNSSGPDGNPILTVTSPDGVTFYLSQRMFDPTTGAEVGPLLTAIDTAALAQSATDAQNDMDSVAAVQALVAQIQAAPGTPITIRSGGNPTPPQHVGP